MNRVDIAEGLATIRYLVNQLPGSERREDLLREVDRVAALLPPFRPSEAAQLFTVSRQALDRWLERGAIPFTTAGSRREVDPVFVVSIAAELLALRKKGIETIPLARLFRQLTA